jgi:hypothetical protein
MTEEINLAFLSRQLDRVLDRIGTMEDQMTVLTGMVTRLDGAMEGLTLEMRGMYRLLQRVEHRVSKLEQPEQRV